MVQNVHVVGGDARDVVVKVVCLIVARNQKQTPSGDRSPSGDPKRHLPAASPARRPPRLFLASSPHTFGTCRFEPPPEPPRNPGKDRVHHHILLYGLYCRTSNTKAPVTPKTIRKRQLRRSSPRFRRMRSTHIITQNKTLLNYLMTTTHTQKRTTSLLLAPLLSSSPCD